MIMNVKYNDLKRVNDTYGEDLTEAINGVLAKGWYVKGREVELFEREFAEYVGTKYCIGVGNGLDALTLILQAWKEIYGWTEGDEVIVPSHTFIATALAVSSIGLKPVFCEVRGDNALMDESLLEGMISYRTKTIIPVHLYGQMCEMDTINQIARSHGLKVLEDACQAHGALYNSSLKMDLTSMFGRRAGNLGCAAAFSFYPGKNLGCLGDGGCVVTNDEDVAVMIRQMANYGQSDKYVHNYKGVNTRLDELQAAILRVKLRRLDKDNARRLEIAKYYCENIKNEWIKVPRFIGDMSNVYHVFPVRCKNRDNLWSYLRNCGIETLIHYPVPIYKQKAYQEYAYLHMPETEDWSNEELSLPLNVSLTDEEVRWIVEKINGYNC